MSEDKEKLTIEEAEESEAAKSAEKVDATGENAQKSTFIPDTDPDEAASLADMDPGEAAVVARVLAQLMVKAENAASGAAEAAEETKTEAAADEAGSVPEDAAEDSAEDAAEAAPEDTADAAPEDISGDAPESKPEDRPVEPPTLHHVLTEEDLLSAEAAEQAEKKSFKGKSKSAFRRLISVATPDNKKFAIPALIAELLVLAALIIILGRYSHLAPPTPTEYADDRHTDVITCRDGELIVNGVTAKVPAEGNVNYGISYVWAEDDTDYPSVPHAIIASYRADPAPAEDAQEASEQSAEQGGDKVVSSDELKKDSAESSSKEADSKDAEAASGDDAEADSGENAEKAPEDSTADDSDSNADSQNGKETESDNSDSNADSDKDKADEKAEEKAAENAEVLYEISLYKDSFTSAKKLPKGKDHKNWFADWTAEQTDEAYKFPYRVGNTRGFCISTMDSKSAPADYRTYTYYFAVPENNGVAIYVLEGTCYDTKSRKKFTTIIKNAINSIEVNVEET